MTAWTESELDRIGAAQQPHLRSERSDGTLRDPVTRWVVRDSEGTCTGIIERGLTPQAHAATPDLADPSSSHPVEREAMEIFAQPPTAKGPADTFTGDVWVDLIHAGPRAGQARLNIVRFAPGARSHWHSHRLGQTLHIIEGIALLGSRDGTVIEAHPGDTIHTGPGEEHWHGASPDRFMAHLVLMEDDGSDAPRTTWGQPVTEAGYHAARTPTH